MQLPSKQGAWVGHVPPTCIASGRTYDYEPVHVAKWRAQRSNNKLGRALDLKPGERPTHQDYASTANQGTRKLEAAQSASQWMSSSAWLKA